MPKLPHKVSRSYQTWRRPGLKVHFNFNIISYPIFSEGTWTLQAEPSQRVFGCKSCIVSLVALRSHVHFHPPMLCACFGGLWDGLGGPTMVVYHGSGNVPAAAHGWFGHLRRRCSCFSNFVSKLQRQNLLQRHRPGRTCYITVLSAVTGIKNLHAASKHPSSGT